MFVYFEINPLSVASFAIIFSHSEGCLFTLLIVSFAVQKLLSFICLFLLLFLIFWDVGHRGSCCDLCRRGFCLCSPLGVLQFLEFFILNSLPTPKLYNLQALQNPDLPHITTMLFSLGLLMLEQKTLGCQLWDKINIKYFIIINF